MNWAEVGDLDASIRCVHKRFGTTRIDLARESKFWRGDWSEGGGRSSRSRGAWSRQRSRQGRAGSERLRLDSAAASERVASRPSRLSPSSNSDGS
jgi:hypothetical protein